MASLFRLYTNRARRALMLADHAARRQGAEKVESEHMLVGLAHDAVTPWPRGSSPSPRPFATPLDEGGSLALRVLAEFGITTESLLAETWRVAGFAEPVEFSDPVPSSEAHAAIARSTRQPPFGYGMRMTISGEIASARRCGDYHVSTVHQLVGAFEVRRRGARQVLRNLGVSSGRDLARATAVVADERERLQLEMRELATDNPSLQDSIATLLADSASKYRSLRKKYSQAWSTAGAS